MVVFSSSCRVTIVRSPGTPEERSWETSMGGDFNAKALFQTEDRVLPGDELRCHLFDQPRIVRLVKPRAASGEVAYWEASIVPRSEWSRRRKVVSPPPSNMSSIAARRKSVLRLEALKFDLRQVFQEGQKTPLKSWEEVREELLSMADDGSVPLDLRTKIGDELNPQDEALKGVLDSASPELRKEAGKIIIKRVLETSDATQFRRSPAHREQVIAESYRNQTAQAFDEIEREDFFFFSYIIQTAHRANKTKLAQPAPTAVSQSREEKHDLLRKFSDDHLGLSGFKLASVLRRDEWRQCFLSWLVKQDLKVRGTRGAPKSAKAEMTRARWEEIGRPQLTAEVRDRLAEFSYPTEFARAKLYSRERKTLRDRVGKQVRPLINKLTPAVPAT